MENRLTIAIPVYNRATYFKEALESALQQTVPVQILIVDNASTEFDFAAAIRSYDDRRLRYVRNERNVGMVGNWNRCLELCETAYLSILHDDDVLYPSATELLLTAIRARPGHGLYFGLDDVIDQNGRRVRNKSEPELLYEEIDAQTYALRNQFAAPGFAIDRAHALALAGYNSRFRMTPDWDLYYRVCARHGAVRVNRFLSAYRQPEHRDSGTSTLARSGVLLPSIALQRKRNLRDCERLTGRRLAASHRTGQAGMAQGLLAEIGWRMSPRGRQAARLYAELEPPKDRWKGLAYRLSPRFFSGLMIVYSWFRHWWRRLSS